MTGDRDSRICAEVQQNLPAWRRGELGRVRRRLLAVHLRRCNDCRAEAARQDDVSAGLAALAAPVEPPPEGLLDDLLAAASAPGIAGRAAVPARGPAHGAPRGHGQPCRWRCSWPVLPSAPEPATPAGGRRGRSAGGSAGVGPRSSGASAHEPFGKFAATVRSGPSDVERQRSRSVHPQQQPGSRTPKNPEAREDDRVYRRRRPRSAAGRHRRRRSCASSAGCADGHASTDAPGSSPEVVRRAVIPVRAASSASVRSPL